ncbi:unnamed protein product [Adineta steineri]|uniref:SHSP domain-containing protein n=1 Tax=Adineta steineri TaxID=433720 RepID=A0A814CKN8_9BILA|nr:unnamed protein product [Adineta steineri]CAF0942137.1 unnamed protein product [Adineta steineri]
MSLFPFYHHRFFDDPFFFNRLDFLDPWFDFHMFPLFPPTASRIRRIERIERQERRSYSCSSSRRSSTNNLELTSRNSQPENFQVQLDINGFNPNTIKQRVEGRKLIVEGKQEERQGNRDHVIREIRGSYELPDNVDTNRLTSHVTTNNKLAIEIPVQNSETERRFNQANNNNNNQSLTSFDNMGLSDDSDIRSRIVDKGNNQKQLEMFVEMKNFRPEEINVSVRNNRIIVEGEHRSEDANRSERSYFYKSTTLPPGTQIDQLQSQFNDKFQLKIEAPYF